MDLAVPRDRSGSFEPQIALGWRAMHSHAVIRATRTGANAGHAQVLPAVPGADACGDSVLTAGRKRFTACRGAAENSARAGNKSPLILAMVRGEGQA